MELGENLRIAREISGKKVYDVEKATGIKHEQIYRWENNKNVPSIIQCIKLADYYGISLDELVGREFCHKEK